MIPKLTLIGTEFALRVFLGVGYIQQNLLFTGGEVVRYAHFGMEEVLLCSCQNTETKGFPRKPGSYALCWQSFQ